MITSKLKKWNVYSTICIIACGILSMCGASINKENIVPVLLVWGVLILLFSVIYLASLKRITVLVDGVEVQYLLLPLWKRFYRFAEFDYAKSDYRRTGEVFRLIKDGKRLVSISSYLYDNYDDIKGAIAVKVKSRFEERYHAEVVSEYDKLRLYGITVALLFFMLMGIGTCFSDLMDSRPVRQGIVIMGVIEILFFGSIIIIFLLPYKKISIWRGQLEVKSLLCPFKIRYYAISDFDGFYYVLEKANGQLGSDDDYFLWLVKDRKMIIGIAESMYKNYDQLKNVFMSLNCLGQMELSTFQTYKYYLGKKL